MAFGSHVAHASSLPPHEHVTNIRLSEPCVRGHRASRCDHFSRWMVRVKKPGRPLRDCPHAVGECSCGEDKVIMVKVKEVKLKGWSPSYPVERFSQSGREIVQFRDKAKSVQMESTTVPVSNCVASIPLSTIQILSLLHAQCEFRIHRIQRARFPTTT